MSKPVQITVKALFHGISHLTLQVKFQNGDVYFINLLQSLYIDVFANVHWKLLPYCFYLYDFAKVLDYLLPVFKLY